MTSQGVTVHLQYRNRQGAVHCNRHVGDAQVPWEDLLHSISALAHALYARQSTRNAGCAHLARHAARMDQAHAQKRTTGYPGLELPNRMQQRRCGRFGQGARAHFKQGAMIIGSGSGWSRGGVAACLCQHDELVPLLEHHLGKLRQAKAHAGPAVARAAQGGGALLPGGLLHLRLPVATRGSGRGSKAAGPPQDVCTRYTASLVPGVLQECPGRALSSSNGVFAAAQSLPRPRRQLGMRARSAGLNQHSI